MGLLASLVSATPDLGCYYFEITQGDILKVKAQVEIKNASGLAFSVLIQAPGMFPEGLRRVCDNEAYIWNSAKSTITVGNAPLSPCLSELKKETLDLVPSPLDIVYDVTSKKLHANIVIPLTMDKASSCLDFTKLDSPSSATQSPTPTVLPIADAPAVSPRADSPAVSPKANAESDQNSASALSVIAALALTVVSTI